MLASSRFTRTTQRRKHKQKRMEIAQFSCACAYTCVVASSVLTVRNDASISTSASTRRLCLRRIGLHVGFLCSCLCLCLRRTCKPGLNYYSGDYISDYMITTFTVGRTYVSSAFKNKLLLGPKVKLSLLILSSSCG